MNLYITNETSEKKWNTYKKLFEQIIYETVRMIDRDSAFNLSVIFVNSESIRLINKEYRNKDQVTDVISFALLDEADPYIMEEEVEIGDIFINIDAIYKQAHVYKHTLKREVCFLFTHGLLHLLGYDHLKKTDEEIMFKLQDEILIKLAPRIKRNYVNDQEI